MFIKRISSFGSALLLTLSSLMVFVPSIALAVPKLCTWTGGGADTKIDTALNWSCVGGGAPAAGDSLDIPYPVAPLSIDNNGATSDFADITFEGDVAATGAQSVTITGTGSMNITGIVDVGANVDATITTTITTGANTSIVLADSTSSLVFGNDTKTVTIGANDLPISGLATPLNNIDIPLVTLGKLVGTSASTVSLAKVGATMNATNPNFDGMLSLDNAVLKDVQSSGAFGTATGGVTLNNSRIEVGGSASVTINDAIDVTGNFLGADSSKAVIGTEVFYVSGSVGAAMDLAGGLTIHNDTLFDPYYGPITVSGPFAGMYAIGITSIYTVNPNTSIIIASSANTSLVPNGNYSLVSADTTISDSQPAQDIMIESGKTVTLTGARGKIIVSGKSTLNGAGGTAAAIVVFNGGILSPGNSPGCINSGNLTLNGTLNEEIGGTTACTGYDQVKVTGTVNISGSTLTTSLYNSYKPKVGETYTIVDNDASDAVTGTFNGLAEGATFTAAGYVYKVSYVGGDGNDIVLTVQTVPAAPNTGFALMTNNPLVTFLSTATLAGAILVLSRRYANVKV